MQKLRSCLIDHKICVAFYYIFYFEEAQRNGQGEKKIGKKGDYFLLNLYLLVFFYTLVVSDYKETVITNQKKKKWNKVTKNVPIVFSIRT